MKLKKLAILMTVLLVMLSVSPVSMAKDPNGADTLVEDPDSPVNFTWVLISAFLVFFMQTGFAILGAGAIRVKNVVSYMTQSYMDFSIGALAFFLVGFAFMFGGSMHAPGLSEGNAFIGLSGFALMGEAYDVTTAMFFLFHVMFAAAAATIVAGAVAGRMKFQAYLIYTAVITTFIYSIHGHWIWGGGWLASLPFGVGAIDFAGSGAVHAVGGSIALAGAYMVGPRKGKFRKDGTPVPIPGHNVSYVVIGAFILFMGWFGFNPGSTFAATDLRIAMIAVNTFLAGATGGVVACYITYFRMGKADVSMICNGSLAGLVGITASCAYVSPLSAVIIGAISACLLMFGVKFVENKLKIDDPVGAISVHGINGIWGLLAVGIFADGTYGGVKGLIVGETAQIVAQAINAVTVFVWSFGLGLILFYALKQTIGLRVDEESEVLGLDMSEHGERCYPEFISE